MFQELSHSKNSWLPSFQVCASEFGVVSAMPITGPDPSPNGGQLSSMNFWHNMFASSQDEASGSKCKAKSYNCVQAISRLDYEWGHVFDKSPEKKKLRTSVVSFSVGNTNSDISGALSAISAALSLSSSASSPCSDVKDGCEQKGEAESLSKRIENLQVELLSLASNGDDIMSSDSYENENVSFFYETEETQRDDLPVPQLGMAFSSEEGAYQFYKRYADKVGFRVRKGKVQRRSNGTIRKRYFFCSKQGFRSKRHSNIIAKYRRRETRTGCGAKLECTVENGKWVISHVSLEHNHYLEGRRFISGSCSKATEAQLVETKNQLAEVKTCVEFSNELPANSCRAEAKVCDGRRTYSLKPEDAQSLLNYLGSLQVEDLSFFYSVQLDTVGRMTNFFWRDGRSKTNYDYFGDVVVLDRTLRMNRYDMTCAMLLGINHHRQYILFGCGFLLDESTDAFVWLLETFVEAMGKHHPKTIITDENQEVLRAVNMVLPNTEHCIGLCSIRQNALNHLSTFYQQPGFDSLFQECISDSHTEQELESRWKSLLQHADLSENTWLNNLYKCREKWARIHTRKTFNAGILGCEHITSVLRNLTNEAISLSEFVQQYLNVTLEQRKEELNEDTYCNKSGRLMILNGSKMERQAANIYTCAMFYAFQRELVKCLSLKVEEIIDNGTVATYKLKEECGQENTVEFSRFDSGVVCSCSKYESIGILCSHALKVFHGRNIICIPPQYILKRWRKSAKDVDVHC